ncbi:MAG: 16S rRNA (guanine(966)-N(2))-methyltransferase RsmD [Thiotrichales bacterium]|nr:MAG: 16S rRNA (guanine(966)-N(2))-methyltransferase RsmD [Thiotrichales bacterium]
MSVNQPGRLRIIAGKWRSRKLSFPDQRYLRPTPDRVRETLFNWLQADVPGSQCLDLFAGSGALGFEAASRGAAQVVMIENNRDAAAALSSNIGLLDADNIELFIADAQEWLNQNRRAFDIVFLDPPYQSGLLSRCCEILEHGQSLAENAKIYIEHAAVNDEVVIPDGWECLKARSAGQVVYKLFSRA